MYFWCSLLGAVVLDRLSKFWALEHLSGVAPPLPGDWFNFILVRNTGAAFGILAGQRWLFMLIAGLSVAGMIGIFYYYRPRRLTQLALGCVGGGALGNAADRILYGSVVDFVSVGWWPVFNLADVAIVSGCIGLLLLTLLEQKGDLV